MYLTQMRLNPGRRGTRRLVGSPQIMHATLYHCLPPRDDRAEPARPLWRLDTEDNGRKLTLYLQSATEPDLTQVVEEAGWPASSVTWRTVDCAPVHQRLETGQRFRFRVTCNPIRQSFDRGRRGALYPVVGRHLQEEWFIAKAGKHGFSIPTNSLVDPAGDGVGAARELVISASRKVQFDRRTDVHHSVTLSVATFDGLLEVTDPDTFRTVLIQGFGRAKAYGCGLITLAASA